MKRRAWLQPLIAALLIAAVFAVFSQTYWFDFINLDDNEYVTENPFVRSGLSWENLRWAFTAFHSGHWHPLTWLSLALDCQVWGVVPGPMHLQNVAWHSLNTALVFLLLTSLTGKVGRSAFVAAVFGLHPLRVESVAWVTERKDVLSVFFWLMSTHAYVFYIRKPNAPRYLLLLLFFALGLIAKPMLVTLPLTLLMLDYWPLRRVAAPWALSHAPTDFHATTRGVSQLVLEKLPLLAIAAAMGTMTSASQRAAGAIVSLDTLPLSDRFMNAAWSYLAYLGMTLWPADLAPFYPLQTVPWQYGAAALILLSAISVLALAALRKAPYFAVGWFWYVITLAPVIGIVQVGGQLMADRFTYVPHIGLLFGATWGVAELVRRGQVPRVAQSAAAVFSIAALATAAWLQTTHWRNSVTLFQHTLSVTGPNFMAHNNLGVALADLGRDDDAFEHYQAAVLLNPTWPEARNNLGKALAVRRDYAAAEREFRTALEIRPAFLVARYNLGLSLAHQGRVEEAAIEYRRAVDTHPGYITAQYRLAVSLEQLGRLEPAVEHYAATVSLDPGQDEARRRLGRLLGRLGRLEEAIAQDREVLHRMPSDTETSHHLANLLMRAGRIEEATQQYRQTLARKPSSAEAHQHLATALATSGDLDAAVVEYQKALHLEPTSVPTLYNLGLAQAQLGRRAEALATLRRAEALHPGWPPVEEALALLAGTNAAPPTPPPGISR